MTIQEIKNRLNVFNFSERQKYILAKIIKNNSFENIGEQNIFQIVQTLPTENINENKIYIVPNEDGKENNVYTEYVYIDGNWEVVGTYTSQIDLTNVPEFEDGISEHFITSVTQSSDSNENVFYIEVRSVKKDETGKNQSFIGGFGIHSATSTKAGILTAADKIKLNNIRTINNAIFLYDDSISINLNDVKQPGYYYTTNNILNKPNGVNSFYLTVYKIDDNNIIQLLFDTNNKIYIRSYNTSSWNNWKEIYSELKTINGNNIVGSGNITVSDIYDIGIINQNASINYNNLVSAVNSGKVITGNYNSKKIILNASIGRDRVNLTYFDYDDYVSSYTSQWNFYVSSSNICTIVGSFELAKKTDIPNIGINTNVMTLVSDDFTYGTRNSYSMSPASSVVTNVFYDINELNDYYNAISNILKLSINGTSLNLTVSNKSKTTSDGVTEFKFICYEEYYRIIVDIKYTTSTTIFTPVITFDKINFLTD